jgi:hypothetical protein
MDELGFEVGFTAVEKVFLDPLQKMRPSGAIVEW